MSGLGRARRALNLAYAAAPVAGISATLAFKHHPAAAVISALIAAAFALSALVWALKQEDRR